VSVVIIGAGPAGCGAARALTAWGHEVVLVDRAGGDHARLAESIPPSARKPMDAVGLLGAVDRAGFLPWRGNTVWWAGRNARIESFPPGAQGYQVVRRDFDRVLLDDVAGGGTAVLSGHAVEVTLSPSVIVTAETPAGPKSIPARFVLDCSGRRGVLARRGLRVAGDAANTVALAGVWTRDDAWPVADPTHTLVASYADGWAWSVPMTAAVRQFTVMVDPRRTQRASATAAREVYRAELRKVAAFQSILDGAALVEGPWGADASGYSAARYGGPGFLLVGDAASAIDPLSSYGVKKALASAWLAAVAVHTAIERPDMTDEAWAFFDRRERAMYAAARRQAAAFAADVAAERAHPFWASRAAVPDEADDAAADEAAAGDPDVAALARDPEVLRAFAGLRAAPALRVVRGLVGHIGPRAAIDGHVLVRQDHLFLPEWPDGVRYLRGVPVVDLLREAPAHTDVGALLERFTCQHPGATAPDVLGALAVLIARGALQPA
jgi:flavin-dependent dehydrogenase